MNITMHYYFINFTNSVFHVRSVKWIMKYHCGIPDYIKTTRSFYTYMKEG